MRGKRRREHPGLGAAGHWPWKVRTHIFPVLPYPTSRARDEGRAVRKKGRLVNDPLKKSVTINSTTSLLSWGVEQV